MKCDGVVIGGGVNGLALAVSCARAGRRVVLCERRPALGGLAAAREFHPGYHVSGILHDTSGVRRSVVDALGLAGFGLRLGPPVPVYVPEAPGPGLSLSGDAAHDGEEIARQASGDAERYRALLGFLAEARKALAFLVEEAPPLLDPEGMSARLRLGQRALGVRRLGRERLTEMVRMAPASIADWLDDHLTGDLLKAALAWPAVVSTFAGPHSPGTAGNFLWHSVLAEGSVVGGPAALVAALEAAARAAGVELLTSTGVEEIRVSAGRVGGVRLANGEEIASTWVAASCDPRETFLRLVSPRHLPGRLEEHLRHYRGSGTVAKVHLALDGPLEFAGRPGERFSFVRTAADLNGLERSFNPAKYGELPEEPSLEVRVEPEAAPAGHAAVSIMARAVPYELRGGWTEAAREQLGRSVVRVLSRFAPGLTDRIVAMEVLAPPDLEREYGVVRGHLFHGDHALDQLVVRPAPECARYRTPIAGLFVCGSGSHPGGGVTGLPGTLAAREVLRGR